MRKLSILIYRRCIPSIIRTFNIDTTTQYGRLLIDGIVPSKENDPAMNFIDRLTTKNYIELGKDYYDLPSPTDLINDMLDELEDND